MIKVSATKLRNNLFDYLDKAADGETIVVQRNNHEVARIVPVKQTDWRGKMKTKAKLLTTPEELIKPLDGVWDDYV